MTKKKVCLIMSTLSVLIQLRKKALLRYGSFFFFKLRHMRKGFILTE